MAKSAGYSHAYSYEELGIMAAQRMLPFCGRLYSPNERALEHADSESYRRFLPAARVADVVQLYEEWKQGGLQTLGFDGRDIKFRFGADPVIFGAGTDGFSIEMLSETGPVPVARLRRSRWYERFMQSLRGRTPYLFISE